MSYELGVTFLNIIVMMFDPRVSVIIECPLNDLFHDLVYVILTSRTAVSEMVDNDWPLVKSKDGHFLEKSRQLTN